MRQENLKDNINTIIFNQQVNPRVIRYSKSISTQCVPDDAEIYIGGYQLFS